MTAASGAVLIIAPNWLGDAVMSLPAVADVRRHYPNQSLVIAARSSVADLFHLVPGVDRIVSLSWRGHLLARGSWREDVAALSGIGASSVVLLPNSFASAWIVHRAGIPERWGYATDARRWLLTRRVPRPGGSCHQAEYYQHLVRGLGLINGPLTPTIAVPPTAVDAARSLLTARGWSESTRVVTLAPGAAYGTAKQWPLDLVARLIEALARDDVRCVLVGSAADRTTVAHVVASCRVDIAHTPIDLAGRTSLVELAGVLGLSSACVANDSGAMHVAAALGTPVVALFGPTIEAETRPLTALASSARVVTGDAWCRPCMLRECPLDHRCMTSITPGMVHRAVAEVRSPSVGEGRRV